MGIGKIIKEKRKEEQLTQENLAEKLFVSNKTISNWENGKTMPDIESVIRFAKLFHLSLDNLLLEGSDIVENIKVQEKIATLLKWRRFPIGLIFVFIFIGYRAIVIDDMILLWGICLAQGLNIGILYYFEKTVRSMRRKKTS